MKKPRSHFRSAIMIACLTLMCWSWINVSAQKPNWIQGNQLVQFPQTLGGSITTSSLPQPNDPSVAPTLQYTGALPVRSQYVETDPNGDIVFFIIDGNIYDGAGYLINVAYRQDYWNVWVEGTPQVWPDWEDRGIHPGAVDLAAIPVPDRCGLWYIFNTVERRSGYPYQLYFTVLDMTVPNLNVGTTDLGTRLGKLLNEFEYLDTYNFQTIGLDPGAQPYFLNTAFLEEDKPLPNDFDTPYWMQERTVHIEVVHCPTQQRKFLLAQAQYYLAKYEILPTGITYLGRSFIEHNGSTLPYVNLAHKGSLKGEVECHCSNNELRVAMSFSNLNGNVTPPPFDDQLIISPMLRVMKFDPASANLNLTDESIHTTGAFLNQQPLFPENGTGGILRWAEVGGLEFSPNGRYTYWYKPAFNNTGGPVPTGYLGYYDWVNGTTTQLDAIQMPT